MLCIVYSVHITRNGSSKRSNTNGVTIRMTSLTQGASQSDDDDIEHASKTKKRRPDNRVPVAQRQTFNESTDSANLGDGDNLLATQQSCANDDIPTNAVVASSELNQLRERLQRRSTRLRSQLDRVRVRLLSVARPRMDSVSSELANEHKATRVLAVVFVCFFTCWTPFFINNLTVGFCGSKCAVSPWVESVILWLGYLSSTLNPIIYTVGAAKPLYE